MAALFVKPGPGLRVRMPGPHTAGHLPPEGAEVPDDTYWHRRIAEGDVTLVQPAVKAASKTARNPDRSAQ